MPAFSIPANLAFDSYDALKAAIAEWMDRSDLTGSIPVMIALAEARMRRELFPLLTETSASVTSVAGVGALPADYSTLNRVEYDGRTLPGYSANLGGSVIDASVPYAYSIEAGQLKLWPVGDWTVTLFYQPGIPALSDTTATNTILDNHPDAYFFGAMVFAEGYVANDQRAATFKSLWDETLFEMRAFLTRQKFAGPLVPRIDFVP